MARGHFRQKKRAISSKLENTSMDVAGIDLLEIGIRIVQTKMPVNLRIGGSRYRLDSSHRVHFKNFPVPLMAVWAPILAVLSAPF